MRRVEAENRFLGNLWATFSQGEFVSRSLISLIQKRVIHGPSNPPISLVEISFG
jgi:hypothetical protein